MHEDAWRGYHSTGSLDWNANTPASQNLQQITA